MTIDDNLLLLLKSSSIGDGEPDLGEKLMSSFLRVLFESGKLPGRITCMNTGIFLTTTGSAVAALLKEFEDAGTEILSCGTCLEYFDRTDQLMVGQAGNMRDTVSAMLSFKRVVSP